MLLHYSQSSCENATRSSSTSPLAFYKEILPPLPGFLGCLRETGKVWKINLTHGIVLSRSTSRSGKWNYQENDIAFPKILSQCLPHSFDFSAEILLAIELLICFPNSHHMTVLGEIPFVFWDRPTFERNSSPGYKHHMVWNPVVFEDSLWSRVFHRALY